MLKLVVATIMMNARPMMRGAFRAMVRGRARSEHTEMHTISVFLVSGGSAQWQAHKTFAGGTRNTAVGRVDADR